MKKHIHIMAICGYTTTGLALMAKTLGYRVTGSDEDAYPPNNQILDRAGIKWVNRHAAENLEVYGKPDVVVQGNQIRPRNPELLAARRMGLKVISDSEFFYQLTENRRRIAVCGSHGKTTTSALVAWILEKDQRQPGFRLGTVARNFEKAVRLGEGREFIFEGDEYTTTYSDKRPKFFHFRPRFVIINNIEWDHPDVFKTRKSYVDLFRRYLVPLIPKEGLIVANVEDENVLTLLHGSKAKVIGFGLDHGDFQAKNIRFTWEKSRFDVYESGQLFGSFETILPGLHNVRNCLGALALCSYLGVKLPVLRAALGTFKGTSRRFEVVDRVKGITVVDDYAHHPTKARETIAAAKARYPDARVFAIYVPHTYSRTKYLLPNYVQAFRQADFVVIPDIEPARERHLKALINSEQLVSEIKKNQENVIHLSRPDEVIDFVTHKARDGDVVLCMSVRGFGDFCQRLVQRLRDK